MREDCANDAARPRLPKLLPQHEVCRLIGISRSTLNRWVREDPEFPQPQRYGTSTVRWRADEVAAYISSRPRIEYPDHGFDPNSGGGLDEGGGNDD